MKMHFFVTSKFLKTTTSLLIFSDVLFALSLFFLYFNQSMPIIEILLIFFAFTFVALQHFFYFRIQFDAEILQMLYQQCSADTTETLTEQLDQSLIDLNLMPKRKAHRVWDLRFKGCFKLFQFQIVTLCFQAAILFIVMILPKL